MSLCPYSVRMVFATLVLGSRAFPGSTCETGLGFAARSELGSLSQWCVVHFEEGRYETRVKREMSGR